MFQKNDLVIRKKKLFFIFCKLKSCFVSFVPIYFWNKIHYWHNKTIFFSLSLLCQQTQSLKLNIYIQYFIIKLQFNFWIRSWLLYNTYKQIWWIIEAYITNKKFFFTNSLHLFMENARVTWNNININQWSILCLLMYLLINLICWISAWKIWWCNFRSLKSASYRLLLKSYKVLIKCFSSLIWIDFIYQPKSIAMYNVISTWFHGFDVSTLNYESIIRYLNFFSFEKKIGEKILIQLLTWVSVVSVQSSLISWIFHLQNYKHFWIDICLKCDISICNFCFFFSSFVSNTFSNFDCVAYDLHTNSHLKCRILMAVNDEVNVRA